MQFSLNQVLDELEDANQLDQPEALYQAFVDWAKTGGRELYEHQEQALLELLDGHHVIAQTPTGSGKSLIALAAHFISLAKDGRSYYTAPLKALVSEKFWDLVAVFGAHNVGMVTGDVSINSDAPIICCTAEILANRSLAEGADLDTDMIIMDEFHFYADPQRGWAWQIPLLELPHPQFVLLSATLGNTTDLQTDLTKRTNRKVVEITSATRPVPLEYEYALDELQPTVERLLKENHQPIYIAHFSQNEAVTTAKALQQLKLIDKPQRDKISTQLKETHFAKGFGQQLKHLLLCGIGVHHAGMLPRYRRIVERLAQKGLLAIISGTDTLGVGINVPIRTVLFTSLVKYDGKRERHLSAREFHQIAGRAGRAGYDTIGYVQALASDTEIAAAKRRARMNAAQIEKNDKKLKKLAKNTKNPTSKNTTKENGASWTKATFDRLVKATPETLRSQFRPSFSMVLHALKGPGDPETRLIQLAKASTATTDESNPHLRELGQIYRSLRLAEVIEKVPTKQANQEKLPRVRVVRELPDDFALNQPLAPFALAALELLDDQAEDLDLNILSVVESVIETPMVILNSQMRRARDTIAQSLRDQGVPYNERQQIIDETYWPEPLKDLLLPAFEIYAKTNPWVKGHELQPKAIVREMIEEGLTFSQFISRYNLESREGLLLRYLSETYRALTQLLPDPYNTERIQLISHWLEELLRAVDSSLIDEWQRLANQQDGTKQNTNISSTNNALNTQTNSEEISFGQGTTGQSAWEVNPYLMRRALRNSIFKFIEAAARDDVDALAELTNAPNTTGIDAYTWDQQLSAYWDEHEWIGVDQDARSTKFFTINEQVETADLLRIARTQDESKLPRTRANDLEWWIIEQVVADPAETREWRIQALVDAKASIEQETPVLHILGLRQIDG